MNRKSVVALGATLLALCSYGIVSAHATLDHCTPAIGSTAATAPAQIVCIYSEEIDTKQSTMSVSDGSGTQVDKKDAHVDLNDPDHKTLIVSLDPAMAKDGLYTVKWHAVTPDDNGISDGSWQFVIGSSNATPYPATLVVQGESPAAETPTAVSPAASATPSSTVAAVPPIGTASVAPTIAPASTLSPEASPTSATPTTAPTTGGGGNTTWMLLAITAVLLLVGGAMVWARR